MSNALDSSALATESLAPVPSGASHLRSAERCKPLLAAFGGAERFFPGDAVPATAARTSFRSSTWDEPRWPTGCWTPPCLASLSRPNPLVLVFCNRCTLLQITETVPPEILFRDYVYFSSFSPTRWSTMPRPSPNR